MENKYSRKYLIETGKGLQAVDNLKTSAYFNEQSSRYIRGEISLDELDNIITSYYENNPSLDINDKEADLVSTKISQLLEDDSFSFSVGQLISIHKYLFDGVYGHAGKLRDYNFSKREWVLDGASVSYCNYRLLEETLNFDFEIEKQFSYKGLSLEEMIDHLSLFISNLWQAHPFEEGNTRTCVVFFIKYLRTLGFDVSNDAFANNAYYFRNALVRANYSNVIKGIDEDRSYLIMFLRNLLLNENNELLNRNLHVSVKPNKEKISKENRIISAMKTKPEITTKELATMLDVSERTVKNIILVLKKDGIIERVNGKKLGHWKVL